MTLVGWTQILVFCAIVVALVKPLVLHDAPLQWRKNAAFAGA